MFAKEFLQDFYSTVFCKEKTYTFMLIFKTFFFCKIDIQFNYL